MVSTETTPSLVEMLLADQQRTTAVEKFSQLHEQGELGSTSHYRELIPPALPAEGQQFAFEVELDACSGCKACVTACHNLNGLEEGETWRSVGLLSGGTSDLPVVQHVTAACHHCVEPACLHGCPVEAYEKDPVTGIVRHLDDQCIGCQYCIFQCPYDVPQYSSSKGIVRKCDMCSDRLANGEAPGCVQGCPNQAIRIAIVDERAVVEESEASHFLPGAAPPELTLPTTVYRSAAALPRNMLPANYYSARAEHGHLPLVFMLVLTQMAVGGFVIEQVLSAQFGWAGASEPSGRIVHLVAALVLAYLGLGAAVLHLGRPLYAFRAFIGLRTSWLSREIIAFGLFAGLATLYVGVAALQFAGAELPAVVETRLGQAAALTGVLGVICSIMIYVDTRRAFWGGLSTTVKFFGTCTVLGVPTVLLIELASTWLAGFPAAEDPTLASASNSTASPGLPRMAFVLCQLVILLMAGKMLFESLILLRLRDRRHTPLKRSALLLIGDLSATAWQRVACGFLGGLLLPALLLTSGGQAVGPLVVSVVMTASLLLILAGELLERYLFFTAAVAPTMPGGPGA